MIRFTLGLALLIFTLIIGFYVYLDNKSIIAAKQAGLRDIENQLVEAQNLQERIRNIRNISMGMGSDQKFTLERQLDIGAPGMEFRFIGQPRYASGSRALFRHTFRINGPATFTDSVNVLKKMAQIPGFAPYKYCFDCISAPKGTPERLSMIQIEGYLYVYDPKLL